MNRIYRFFDDKAVTEPTNLLPKEGNTEPGRDDFDLAYDALAESGLRQLKERNAAWAHYQELRGRYAAALSFLSKLTMSPGLKLAY